MKKLNQSGFIGIIEIAALVVLGGVITFTVYRVFHIKSDVNKSLHNTTESSESAEVDPIKLRQEKDEPKEAVVPDKEDEKQEVEVEKETETETEKETESENKENKTTYIDFVSRSANQSGSNINATGVLESNQTGTCYFKFKKEGYDKVLFTSSITNSKNCTKSIPAHEFPAGGTWQYYVYFQNANESVVAEADALSVNVTP